MLFAAIAHSRLWHIRDIARSQIEVRFRCKSGHAADISGTHRLTLSGHRADRNSAAQQSPAVPEVCYLRPETREAVGQ